MKRTIGLRGDRSHVNKYFQEHTFPLGEESYVLIDMTVFLWFLHVNPNSIGILKLSVWKEQSLYTRLCDRSPVNKYFQYFQ